MGENLLSDVVGLPTGSVTFVFTDIEGSTHLLRRWGDAYADALEQHRRVIREVTARSGGVEVSVEGDACFMAFGSADAAMAGCTAAQHALTRQAWPEGGDLRVRVGMHTGVAFPRDGNYVALAVHQAARVVHAAHGGQVLASQDTVDALRAAPPEGGGLTELGRYRLRDFDGPVALYQVGGGDRRFPAVRAVPADQHNLSPAGTTFVGRTAELDEIGRRLQPGRALTIVGMGGVGKTRLVTEVGMRVAPSWADGVWMVDLSALGDPALVGSKVADALGRPATGGDRDSDVLDGLLGMDAVLVLDNCEQVIDACAAFTRDILKRAPSVAVLATSREPLGIAGEVVYRLTPLREIDDAAALFLDRMGDTSSAPADRATIERLCERCDRIPLAIELAASRCGVMTVAEIAAGLDERFRLLRTRDRELPARQRTMTAVLDWSYELLEAAERTALERLAVFSGTFDLDGATVAVAAGGVDGYDVPELVWSLAEKSLVVPEPSANATRYRVLETVRAYAGLRLDARQARAETEGALAAWYLEQFPLRQRGDLTWLSRLALEAETVSGLISSLARDDPSLPSLARLRGELRSVAGEPRVGWEEIDGVLATGLAPTPSTARLVLYAASLLGDGGEMDQALRRCAEGEALLDEVGDTDRWGSVRVASPRSMLLLRSDRPDDLVLAEQLARADVPRATTDAERADALVRLALTQGALGMDGAGALYEEAIVIARRIRDHVLVALSLNNLAETELRQGLLGSAADHQREALTYAAELGMEHIVTFGLISAARIAADVGSFEVAVRLHTVAERRLEETGLRLYPDDQVLSDAMLDRAASVLGAAAFAGARRSADDLDAISALAEADRILVTAAGDR